MEHVNHGRQLLRRRNAFALTIVCFAAQLLTAIARGEDVDSAATPTEHRPVGVVDETAGATPKANLNAVSADQMTASIDLLIVNELGVYGVVLMRPDGTVMYNRNGDTPFVSASLYKLILLAKICHAIDAGVISPDMPLHIAPEYYDDPTGWDSYYDPSLAGLSTTVQEAMFAAGAYSSNVAAKALLSITTHSDLNETAATLGLTGTHLFVDPTSTPSWPPVADADTTSDDAVKSRQVVLGYATDGMVNLTTPMDMARYFMLLINGRIYNEHVSGMLMAILQEQTVDDRFPALLPAGTQIAHKTGNLEHVVHDVGIIFAPGGPMILAAMVEAPLNDERATQIVQRLALIAYGIYDVPPLTAAEVPEGDSSEMFDGTSIALPVGTPVEMVPGDPDGGEAGTSATLELKSD